MSRTVRLAALALLALAVAPTSALAHEGNPNYRSVVNEVSPPAKGLKLNVLNLDDRLQLINNTGQTVVVKDYDGDPYVRVMGDGTVQQNQNSVATYINDDRDGKGTIPPGVKQGAAPVWKLIDRSGRFEWHDHRIHYMGTGRPATIKDPKVKAKAFDWKVPITVGSQAATIRGSLFWVPKSSGGVPGGAVVGFLAILLIAAAVVITTRRRRAGQDPGEPVATGPVREAW